jgi:probable rRNA maturation factor
MSARRTSTGKATGKKPGKGSATTPGESAEPPRSLAVDIVTEAGDWSSFGSDLETAIEAAARAVASIEAARVTGAMEAVVALANDVTVKRLNHQFRGQNKPTNVLSFPSGTPKSTALGDIVLALETLRGEAVELEIPPLHHVQHLTVHGLLHLLGFDHVDAADAEIMERLEVEILKVLGVADPYAGRVLVRGA